MKLKRVKWDSHPILGDLELDFNNKETNILFLFLLKKHFLLLILFLNYYKMNKKCVENILIIF